MCGIIGQASVKEVNENTINKMNKIISHRGPDDSGIWVNNTRNIGLGHRRLSIIDLSNNGHQPMHANDRYTIVFNGEIYNHNLIRNNLAIDWNFKSKSDTEVILAAYIKYGPDCLKIFRGMFAFAIWDNIEKTLFCARDQFGIKPFYYTKEEDSFSFASEAKALLSTVNCKTLNKQSILQYITFQIPIDNGTFINEIKQLMPGHYAIYNQRTSDLYIKKYWDINYEVDYNIKNDAQAKEIFNELLIDSINAHLSSDVPVGSYLSGGIDSSLISIIAAENQSRVISMDSFHGRFTDYQGYDESTYAKDAAKFSEKQCLHIADITSNDFLSNIKEVIHSLDFPIAGPGSLPQYIVSKLASQHVKVVLGGQGGDEIFGGYARYMVAYLEQCIKSSILGTESSLEVPFANILPNIKLLKEYTPLIKNVWSDGLFDEFYLRYFKIINRSNDFSNEVRWDFFKDEDDNLMCIFKEIFNSKSTDGSGFLNKMLHFDFKTLLPALLQVEDRMSMAHGIESRVPLLDVPIVEFAAKLPPNIKFCDGKMKHIIKHTFSDKLPKSILNRRDKMGFTVPINEWFKETKVKDFLLDVFKYGKRQGGDIINYDEVINLIGSNSDKYSRKIWGLLSLEIWMQKYMS